MSKIVQKTSSIIGSQATITMGTVKSFIAFFFKRSLSFFLEEKPAQIMEHHDLTQQ
jgi:hypothetical protein